MRLRIASAERPSHTRRLTRAALAVLVAAPSLSTGGCASMLGRVLPHAEGGVYQGVQMDVQAIRRGSGYGPVVGAIDLPLSAALDTALLPVDLVIAAGD